MVFLVVVDKVCSGPSVPSLRVPSRGENVVPRQKYLTSSNGPHSVTPYTDKRESPSDNRSVRAAQLFSVREIEIPYEVIARPVLHPAVKPLKFPFPPIAAPSRKLHAAVVPGMLPREMHGISLPF